MKKSDSANAAPQSDHYAREAVRYSPELAAEICRLMSEGKSLRQVCELPGMPTRQSVLRWVEGNASFREQYQRAREALYDFLADEVIRLADDDSGDYFIENRNGESVYVTNHAAVQRSKLRVEARKWLLSKVAAKKYGDRPQDDAAPQGLTITWQQATDPPPPPVSREPPKQLVYRQPEPGSLTPKDWAALTPVLDLIMRTIPSNSDTPPAEVFDVIRRALLAHFADK